MHELAIARNIAAVVRDATKDRKVLRVTLEIGRLSGVVPDAVETCFAIVIEDTPLAGAALDVRLIEGQGLCGSCGGEFPMPALYAACSCGGRATRLLRGEELLVKSVELADGP